MMYFNDMLPKGSQQFLRPFFRSSVLGEKKSLATS